VRLAPPDLVPPFAFFAKIEGLFFLDPLWKSRHFRAKQLAAAVQRKEWGTT
jgi:hypothetical protein